MGTWPTEWHPFYKDEPCYPELEDHCYYLVTDTRFGTPMKAQWHQDVFRWDIRGVTEGRQDSFHAWDPDCPIIAWCELPPVYEQK